MKKIWILLLLSGCATPYVDVGAGYFFEGRNWTRDEDCSVGYIAVGVERGPWATEFQHTSCINEKPELVLNQVVIKRRFGGE